MTQDEAQEKLEEYRVMIDAVDRRIVELLNERTRVVEGIGRVKREAHLPIYEPKREDMVFANITASNQGPLPAAGLRIKVTAQKAQKPPRLARFTVTVETPDVNEAEHLAGVRLSVEKCLVKNTLQIPAEITVDVVGDPAAGA